MAARIQLPRVSKFPARHFYSSAVLAGKPRVGIVLAGKIARARLPRDHSTNQLNTLNKQTTHLTMIAASY
jgi:hypothetical protein